jgi:hypothetical protein
MTWIKKCRRKIMKLLKVLTIILLVQFLISCQEDSDCNDPSVESIKGLWQRNVTDDAGLTFDVYIMFEDNDTYAFLLAEPAEGHTNSYAKYRIADGNLEIYDDSDCEINGLYEFSVQNNKLILTKINDDCEPRLKMLEAEWQRVL